MLGFFLRKLKFLWKNFRKSHLSRREVRELTLYPDQPLKSLRKIRSELFRLCRHEERGTWATKAIILDYFNMGLDRKGQDVRQYIFKEELDAARNAMQPISAPLLSDKWITATYLKLHDVPTTCPFLFKNAFVSDEEALSAIRASGHRKFFAKMLDGALGEGAFSFYIQDDHFVIDDEKIVSDAELVAKLHNYIVEPYIEQHPQLKILYPHGVSSLRIVTVCVGRKIDIILATLLVGAGGIRMSNFHQGGLRVPINIATGDLAEKGLRIKVKRGWYTAHPDTGVLFKDFRIPYWNEVADLVIRAHRCFPTIHSVGWDVAITPSGPIIIEGNWHWVPHSFQFTEGPGRAYMKQFFSI